jgi:3-deoxy-7-phosphoheptulonate synthase
MIVIMKRDAAKQDIDTLVSDLTTRHIQVQKNEGVECTVLGLLGDTASLDRDALSMRQGVERVMQVSEPFKKANRKFHPHDTVVSVGDVQIGEGTLTVIAGPCSVETEDQIVEVAKDVKEAGAAMLRGGAFKPRTSPYAFQGLEEEGLVLLNHAKKATGLPIVSEMTSATQVNAFERLVDVIQIGARNMQNFELLKEVGRTNKPVLLKRGLSSTIEEWLMSAEYIMSRGNENVILCERGIRTFETYTRNTLDLSAVVAVKKLSHLPVVVDPSHATGKHDMVEPLALAAIAAGADGLIIEVHNDPSKALSDGPQSLKPEAFADLMVKVRSMAELVGKAVQ